MVSHKTKHHHTVCIFFMGWTVIGTNPLFHYYDVIMGAIASQITSPTAVYSTVYSAADQRKHQSSAPLAFVRGIHRGPVNFPHKWPVTRKCFHLVMSSCNVNLIYVEHNSGLVAKSGYFIWEMKSLLPDYAYLACDKANSLLEPIVIHCRLDH